MEVDEGNSNSSESGEIAESVKGVHRYKSWGGSNKYHSVWYIFYILLIFLHFSIKVDKIKKIKSVFLCVGTSTPQVAASADKNASNKRFDFLLQQTELFSHFMGSSKASSPLKVKDKKKKVNKGKEGDNRHRYGNSLSHVKGHFLQYFDPDPIVKISTKNCKIFFSRTPSLNCWWKRG